jgi:hypothetical protein
MGLNSFLAWLTFAFLPVVQVEGGRLPTQIECLSAGVEDCPTEDDSGASKTTGKAGRIVAFVIVGVICVLWIVILVQVYMVMA